MCVIQLIGLRVCGVCAWLDGPNVVRVATANTTHKVRARGVVSRRPTRGHDQRDYEPGVWRCGKGCGD